MTRDGTIFDKQKAKTHFRERPDEENGTFGDNKLGINTLSVDIINQDIEPDDLRPILKKSFKSSANHPRPGILLSRPDAKLIVEKKSDEIVIDSIVLSG